jgi:hypothetical protein
VVLPEAHVLAAGRRGGEGKPGGGGVRALTHRFLTLKGFPTGGGGGGIFNPVCEARRTGWYEEKGQNYDFCNF